MPVASRRRNQKRSNERRGARERGERECEPISTDRLPARRSRCRTVARFKSRSRTEARSHRSRAKQSEWGMQFRLRFDPRVAANRERPPRRRQRQSKSKGGERELIPGQTAAVTQYMRGSVPGPALKYEKVTGIIGKSGAAGQCASEGSKPEKCFAVTSSPGWIDDESRRSGGKDTDRYKPASEPSAREGGSSFHWRPRRSPESG